MWRSLALFALVAELVIPPGREALVMEMLGGSTQLPGSCTLAGASIDRTFVSARYTCAGREVRVELRHPREAPGAPGSAELAVVALPDAPGELVGALTERVRARSGAWTWIKLTPSAPDPALARPDTERPHRALALGLLLAIPLAVMALRALAARRRRA